MGDNGRGWGCGGLCCAVPPCVCVCVCMFWRSRPYPSSVCVEMGCVCVAVPCCLSAAGFCLCSLWRAAVGASRSVFTCYVCVVFAPCWRQHLCICVSVQCRDRVVSCHVCFVCVCQSKCLLCGKGGDFGGGAAGEGSGHHRRPSPFPLLPPHQLELRDDDKHRGPMKGWGALPPPSAHRVHGVLNVVSPCENRGVGLFYVSHIVEELENSKIKKGKGRSDA